MIEHTATAFQKIADSAFSARVALDTFRVIADTRDDRYLPGVTEAEALRPDPVQNHTQAPR